MSRLYLRRGRVLPGPLKVLQQAERRSSAPVTSLALTAAALAAALLLTPHGAARLSVDPEPMVDVAEAGAATPETHVSAAPPPLVIAATPAQAEPVVTAPAPVASLAPEPARPAPVPPVAQVVAAPAKPPADRSLFELDLLPVLQTGGPDLDIGAAPVAPPKVASKAPARRTSTANRGAAIVASDDSAQP